MRPILDGSQIMKALGMKSGPWLAKAQDMLIRWQLLHPEITDRQIAVDFLMTKKDELCG
jgi:tRNA nucleotidyltransferase (CCA-adding enzyme)